MSRTARLSHLRARLGEAARLPWPGPAQAAETWRRTLPSAARRPNGSVAGPTLNLALQGGGAHGAFTWGVLDRLLEDGRLRLASVSGTSAGAMNAVVLANGLMEGGPEGARARLEAFWRAVSATARYSPLRPHPLDLRSAEEQRQAPTGVILLDLMTRLVSPYQFNPLDFNPLRDVLERSVDFKRLRRDSPLDLYIAATDVATGKQHIFRTREVSLEAVLASACLPQLHRAVKVGRRHYWDGGFSANPPVLPLVQAGRAQDTLIVQIDPAREPELPTDARAIIARVNRITFNAPLRREVELLEHLRALAEDGVAFGGAQRRRIRRHRFHHIEAGHLTRELGRASKLHPEWDVLCRLHEAGRGAAEAWLKRHGAAVGRASTVDLAAKFL